jgi:hypothetical protein
MPNKLTAAIVALAIASASPAHVNAEPTRARDRTAPARIARLDAFGVAAVGLHRLGAFLIALDAYEKRVFVLAVADSQARAQARPEAPATQAPAQASPPSPSSGACGGDLPPCWIMLRESGGNIRAQNATSSASGKWQMLDSTWGGFMGYARAADAPEWVQDAKARTMALCNWTPPNYCA